MEKHILFTARDIGAAQHIKHIAKFFKKRGYKISVVASGLGYKVLKKDRLMPIPFSINSGKPAISHHAPQKLVRELLTASYNIINSINPDVVFCGLAAADYGIDEAVLYWASSSRLNIPSFQFLDSWGAFNHLRDGYPDMYFAIDQTVLEYCYRGAKAQVMIVGSPKHESFSSKPLDKWRSDFRKEFGIDGKTKLIGYFGQDPHIPGHTYNFMKLVEAVAAYNKRRSCKLLISPHPAYRHRYRCYWSHLRKTKLETIDVGDTFSVEEILSACDLVTTIFSTVGVDHAYLSCYARTSIGTLLYLLCGEEIKEYLQSQFGYYKFPLLKKGIGFYVDRADQILDKIECILENSSMQTEYFQATKSLVNNNPCEKLVNAISSFIRWRGGYSSSTD